MGGGRWRRGWAAVSGSSQCQGKWRRWSGRGNDASSLESSVANDDIPWFPANKETWSCETPFLNSIVLIARTRELLCKYGAVLTCSSRAVPWAMTKAGSKCQSAVSGALYNVSAAASRRQDSCATYTSSSDAVFTPLRVVA